MTQLHHPEVSIFPSVALCNTYLGTARTEALPHHKEVQSNFIAAISDTGSPAPGAEGALLRWMPGRPDAAVFIHEQWRSIRWAAA